LKSLLSFTIFGNLFARRSGGRFRSRPFPEGEGFSGLINGAIRPQDNWRLDRLAATAAAVPYLKSCGSLAFLKKLQP
jgi:hypothetical protein